MPLSIKQHVLVFIDLDNFKAVNDSAGHAAGDALLRELSDLMQHPLRSSDFLARLGRCATKTPQAAFIWLLDVQLLTADGLLLDETLLRNNLPDETLRRRLDNNILEAFFRHNVQRLNNKGIPVILPLNAQALSDAAFVQQLCQRFVATSLSDSRCGFAFPAASVLSKGDQLYAALLQLRQCGCRIVLQHYWP